MDILGFFVWLVVSAVVLMIVDKLNMGLKVGGFKNAALAAIVIAVVTAVVIWFSGLFGITLGAGLLGPIWALIVAAVVLMLSARLFKGMSVSGFKGAVIAAVGIAVVGWVVNYLLALVF